VLVQQELSPAVSGHLGIQGRHAASIESLHPVGKPGEARGEPVASRLDGVQPVVRDAGKSAELFQLVDEAARILFDVLVDSGR
jgi:hypothetical protein